MTILGKILRGVALALGFFILALLFALWRWPPDLLRVGANYSAKIVCSNVFLAGRDPDEVLLYDVQSPGNPLLRLMQIFVDRRQHTVRAGMLGFIGNGLAVERPGQGCTVVADGDLARALRNTRTPKAAAMAEPAVSIAPPASPAAPIPSTPNADPAAAGAATRSLWPDGDAVATQPALDRILEDHVLAGPGIRAIVVVDHGRIIAERYGTGITATTPLLGWSMTKTVLAGLIGTLVKQGKLTLDQAAGWPAGDGRERIRIADLMAMSSGLRFNEAYGVVSDVTRMLYLEPDMARFAASQPLDHPVGTYWSYSSGTANILSRIVQEAAGPAGAGYPSEALFKPLGMTSATMETDEGGVLVGSSYMYASARDWARFGQFLAQNGVWQGQELLPAGFVDMMSTPVAASGGEYGQGLVWMWAMDPLERGKNPDSAYGIPADTFWLSGHDGQSIAVMRSRQMVIVRMGLTPAKYHYLPEPLVKAILDATR